MHLRQVQKKLQNKYISRFHEGLLTLKGFPNVLVCFQKFRLETFSMLYCCDRFISYLGILPLKNILFNDQMLHDL